MPSDDAWLEWVLTASPDRFGHLVAELADLGFEGFEERSDQLWAYIPEHAFTADVQGRLRVLLGVCGVGRVRSRCLAATNWNAAWEASIEPVEAGVFVVHPPWNDPPEGRTAILIVPQMSFGTGHHETTRLMLEMLPDLVKPGDRVLDAGTGTGVLAIGAALLGARTVVGFDTDPWAVRNAIDNSASNGVSCRVRILEGSIEAVPDEPVDVILANINRNVLINLMSAFTHRLVPDGRLAISGLLVGDREVMRAALEEAHFRMISERTDGEWLALSAIAS